MNRATQADTFARLAMAEHFAERARRVIEEIGRLREEIAWRAGR